MSNEVSPHGSRRPVANRVERSALVVVASVVLASLGLAACGSSDDPGVTLTPAGEAGKAVAESSGCASCHSASGRSSVGPTWKGQWGTEVELDDGTTVVFDETYVKTAVREPSAQRPVGNWIQMPMFPDTILTDAQLASLITYMKELGAA